MKRIYGFLLLLLLFASLFPILLGIPDTPEDTITVFNSETQKNMQISLEEFLVGVVAAEMPALFETESLKAQAVAARTYVVSRIRQGETICTDPAHCQAYADSATLKERWGEHYTDYLKRISNAVKQTEGVIVVYDNEPIAAVFHAGSSGRTEDGASVWGSETPYLKSVESSLPTELNEMESETAFERSAFIETLKAQNPAVTDTKPLLGAVTLNESGRVEQIILGGVPFGGTEIRTLFSLNSTDFTLTENDTQIFIVTRGKGHGVGLSQYGSNELAKQGKNYQEILKHYYRGISLHKLENL